MKITINNKTYEVIKNEKDAIDEEVLKEAITEYFENFDFIVGDWAYGKLRLKGFNDKSNKNFKPINDIKNVLDDIATKASECLSENERKIANICIEKMVVFFQEEIEKEKKNG